MCEALLPSTNHPRVLPALSSCQHFPQALSPLKPPSSAGFRTEPAPSIPTLCFHSMFASILRSSSSGGSPDPDGSHHTPKFPKLFGFLLSPLILGHVQLHPHGVSANESTFFCIAQFLPRSFMTSLISGSPGRFYQQPVCAVFRPLIQKLKSMEMLLALPRWEHGHCFNYCRHNYILNPIN